MMKRILALILIVCLLPVCALAGDEGPLYALVNNDKLTDRLNLREKPDSASATLGRYYNGTMVEVIDKGDVWSYVRVGGRVTGYMMNDYLIFFDDLGSFIYGREMCGWEESVFRGRLNSGTGAYNSIKDGQPAYWTAREEEIIILGDVNDDWLHVCFPTSYSLLDSCYVRRQDIGYRYIYGKAVVVSNDPEAQLNLRAEPKNDAKVIGKYYAGTVVSVHETRNGFAKVSVLGEGRNYTAVDPYEQTGFQQGYMKLDYLRFGSRADWIGTENCLPIAYVKNGYATVYDINREPVGTLARGMRMLVLGTFGNGDYLHVDTGTQDPVLIRAKDVQVIGGAHTQGDMPVLGYGVIRDLEDYEMSWGFVSVYEYCDRANRTEELFHGESVAILSVGDTWAQVSRRGSDWYIPVENLQMYLLDEVKGDRTAGSGTYLAGTDMKSGLYTYECAAGESLQVKTESGSTKLYGGDAGAYTLYLNVGDSITLNGGVIGPMAEDEMFIDESAPTYSGSGRYLCGEHLRPSSYWDYYIMPLDPHEEAYYMISTLTYETTGVGSMTKVVLTEGESAEGADHAVTLYPGEILEFHNCVITINYGNG